MLGQDALVTTIHKRMLATGDGGGACVLSGGPGVGKTFVAERFLRELPRTTARLRGRGLRTGGAPLLPICEAIRTCPQARNAERLRSVFEQYVQALPYVKDALGPLVKATAGKARHAGASLGQAIPSETYAFVALARVLDALAGSDVPVLFLDDLQWVDPTSIGFLGYVASQIRDTRVFLLLTRRVDGEDEKQVAALLETLRQDAGERSVELLIGDLSREDQTAVLRAVLGRVDVEQRDLEWLHASSRGNPYYLRELIALLRSQGHLVDLAGTWRLLSKPAGALTPPSLERHVRERLSRVAAAAPFTLDVVQFAACAGTVFDARVVADALGESQRRVATALRGLEEATGIVRREGRTTCFRFDHDLTRESVISELGEFAREIHGRLGNVLSARTDALPVTVAYQFAAAGEQQRAADWFLKAAERANTALLYDAALQYGRDAERLLAEVPAEKTSRMLARTSRIIGTALVGAERYAEAVNRLTEDVAALPDREAGPIHHLLGRASSRLADEAAHRRAITELRIALDTLRSAGDDEGCAAVWSDLVQAHDALGDYAASQASFREALQAARRTGNHSAVVRLMRLTCVFWQPEKVVDSIEKAIVLAKRYKLRSEEALCENNLGTAWFALGDFERARYHLARAHAGLRAQGGFRCDVPLNNMGLVDLAEGRAEQADANFSASFHSAVDPQNMLFIRSNRAVAQAMGGSTAEAIVELGKIVALADASGDLFYRDCLRHNLANALLEAGGAEEAYKTATECGLHHDAGDDLLVAGKRARLLARTFEARQMVVPDEISRQAAVLDRTTKPQAWLYRLPWYYCDIEFWED